STRDISARPAAVAFTARTPRGPASSAFRSAASRKTTGSPRRRWSTRAGAQVGTRRRRMCRTSNKCRLRPRGKTAGTRHCRGEQSRRRVRSAARLKSSSGTKRHDRRCFQLRLSRGCVMLGTELLEALPVAVYTTDAEGRITYYNEAAAELWGRRPQIGTSQWCGSCKIYWPDGRSLPHDECPMAVTLKTGQPVRGVEAIAERPDGTRVNFLPYPTPLRDASGRLTGAINLLLDISERHTNEVHAARLAAIVATSDDAIVSKTLEGRVTSWNAAAT